MNDHPPSATAAPFAVQWRPSPDDQDIYRALVGRRMQVDRPLRVPWSDPLRRWPWLREMFAGAARRAREGADRLAKR